MKYIFAITLFFAVLRLPAQLIYETVWVDYDSAWEYKSLRLIPVRTKDPHGKPNRPVISLNRALKEGAAIISERGSASTENVHWLKIDNRSDKTIYVASGQTFSGGRQDRMVSKDTLLEPSGKSQFIPVMCIEEGRWSEKEKKLLFTNYANTQLRQVLDKSKNQVLVWKEIFSQLDSAQFNSPTFAYNALRQSRNYQAQEQEYLDYFREKYKRSDSSMVGFVCVSGNRVIGTDIFAYREMFYDELEPLLYGYISEALLHGSAPSLVKDEIKEFMDQILTSPQQQEEYCRKNGKIFRAQGKVIHVTAY